MNEQNNLLDSALNYLSMGFAVIPINGKIPVIKSWKEYQQRLPTEVEVKQWFSRTDVTGIAIITGSISGIVVLDIENGVDLSGFEFPPTVVVKTGGGGFHYYFRHQQGVKNSVKKIHKKMDIRAEGGYVLVPPSLHSSGNCYEWLGGCSLDRDKLADIPQWLNEKIKSSVRAIKDWKEITKGVEDGRRTDSATSIIGKLLYHLPTNVWESIGWELTEAWNERNDPPKDSEKLRDYFDSIAQREWNRRNEIDNKEVNPISLGELLKMDFPTTTWRIESILPVAGKGIISGVAGVGKTWILAELARSVALGISFLDKFPVTQTNVLIIDEDMGIQELQRRWKMLPNTEELYSKIFFLSLTNLRLDSEIDIEYIKQLVETKNIGFVIIDPLIGTHSHDENDAKGMRKFFDQFKDFKEKNVSIIFAHHHRKQQLFRNKNLLEGIRGSSGIPADIESAIAVDEDDGSLMLVQTKNRNAPKIKPFKIKMSEEAGKMTIRYEGECDLKKIKKDEAKDVIQELLKGELRLSTSDIKAKLKELGIGKTNIEDALKEMTEDEELKRTKIKGRGNSYDYMLPTDKDVENGIIEDTS